MFNKQYIYKSKTIKSSYLRLHLVRVLKWEIRDGVSYDYTNPIDKTIILITYSSLRKGCCTKVHTAPS